MGSESELVLHLWETFKDAMPASKREDAANKMLRVLSDWGIEMEDIAEELHGEDTHLDKALEHYMDEEDDDTDEDDGDDDNY